MGKMKSSLKLAVIVLFACALFIGCSSEASPVESMIAPIHVVRNDSITEVKDNTGTHYVLNTVERTDYGTAFLEPGEELIQKGAR
jgi:ABC-type transport system substrate-binding protein